MRVRRGLLPAVAALVMPVVMMGAAVPAAAQDDGSGSPPLPGWFVRDSLIYPNTPDGWACHFLGRCRPPGARTEGDSGPIAVVGHGQNAVVVCQFGSYVKITTTPTHSTAPLGTGTQPPRASPSSRPTTPPTTTPTPRPAPTGPAQATTSRPTGSHTPNLSAPPGPVPRSAGPASSASSSAPPPAPASTPPSSRPSENAPLTVTGGPPELIEPVSGWAPVADIATPPDRRAARCTVDQWAW